MEFPVILDDEDVLVPIKIDVVHKGAHVVNSLSWNIYNSFMTPEEFAWKFCADLALPSTTTQKIACQIHDQLSAFEILIGMLRSLDSFDVARSLVCSKLPSHVVEMEIKHGIINYKDKFNWDPFSSAQSPESFAKITCADVGFPADMEPIISYNIRESTIRWILKCLDSSNLLLDSSSIVNIVSDVSLSLATPKDAMEQLAVLWNGQKPISPDDDSTVVGTNMIGSDLHSGTVWLTTDRK